jgi:hypothetical protein
MDGDVQLPDQKSSVDKTKVPFDTFRSASGKLRRGHASGIIGGNIATAKGSRMKIKFFVGMLVIICASLTAHAQSDWQKKVHSEMSLMGHRNWIAVVDSAYPLQSSSGIETIETNEDHLAVLDYVLKEIRGSRHIRALAHTDMELQYVPEAAAPGVTRLQGDLKRRLAGVPVDYVPHQSLIDGLNATSQTFHVLILKTTMTIPYSSVFLQLDCSYWSAEAEAKMRKAIKDAGRDATK